jgi:hypothetical protein
MWRWFAPYAPTAGFWLIALAITVGGFQSLPIAAVLGVLGAVCLLIPARPWLGRVFRYRKQGLSIETGEGGPFDTYQTHLHTRTHLIRVRISNNMSRAATNCEFVLENITGPLTARCPVYIKRGFILNPSAGEYIDIAEFDERIDDERPYPSKPGLIRVHFPINPLSSGNSYLDAGVGSYGLTFIATAAESAAVKMKCRLWLDRGLMKLEKN